MIRRYMSLSVVSLIFASSALGADWGDVTARFVLDGSAPSAMPLSITKDQEFCGKFGLVDEQLSVNPENKGIANVVVFIYVGRGDKQPPVHDSYKATEKAEVRIDNDKCRFEPHIIPVRTSQTLVAGNLDTVAHNTNLTTIRNPPQNVLIPAKGELKLNLTAEESLPVPVSCNIHPWMKGYVVVKEHPYVAVSDKDGKVTLKNVPAGKWTLQVWQEASGYVTDVNVGGKKTTWTRGRFELDVKAGANDLGEVKIPVSLFKLN